MKKIKLTQGKYAMIDDEDFEKVSQYKWCYSNRYATTTQKGITFRMHRYILGAIDPALYVDHINSNSLDNRKSNLRFVTPSQNAKNKSAHKNSYCGYKGVSRSRLKFKAQIFHNRKSIFLGVFDNPEDAAEAYNKKAKELFGEFARLNIIPEANNE